MGDRELTAEKAVGAFRIVPEITTGAHLGSGDTGTTKTEMGGADGCKTKTGIDVTTDRRVGTGS